MAFLPYDLCQLSLFVRHNVSSVLYIYIYIYIANSASNGLDRISRERFKQGAQNCTALSRTNGLTQLLDSTWLSASGRLQKTVVYCIKMRKNRPESNNYESPNFTWTSSSLQFSQNRRKCVRRPWVELEWCSVLPNQLMGFLFT